MAALFSGISDEELAAMLSCLGARIDTFPKGSRLLRAGESVEEVGLVLAGSALIVQEDIWGNRNILSKTGPGQTFAEVFACAPGAVLNVSVEAESAVTVMFLHIRRVLSVCPSACSHHSRIIRNLLGELAEKNLRLNEKLTHMGQRTTRAKLIISFLQRRKKAENILIDAPGLRRCLCDLDLAALQFLTDRLTHSLQQFPLIFVFTDHPANGTGALTCRNIHQRPPRLPLDGRGHGEGQVQPLLVTAHAFSTFALSDAHIPWHLSKRHPV